MSYSALKTRVTVAEEALAAQLDHTQSSWYRLKAVAGEAFTPARIVGSGVLSGLIVGFTAPWARLGGTMRIVELGTSVANLVGALQAQAAAEEASDAADSASEVAADTVAVAEEAQAATEQTQAVAEQAAEVTEGAAEAVAVAEEVTAEAQQTVDETRAASGGPRAG